MGASVSSEPTDHMPSEGQRRKTRLFRDEQEEKEIERMLDVKHLYIVHDPKGARNDANREHTLVSQNLLDHSKLKQKKK
jgi:hypothetical protein